MISNIRCRATADYLPMSGILLAFGAEFLVRHLRSDAQGAFGRAMCRRSWAQEALEAALVIVRRQRCRPGKGRYSQ